MTLFAPRSVTQYPGIPTAFIGAPRLLRGLDQHETVGLATHVSLHGGLPILNRVQLTTITRQANLTGRGGAGFAFADKLNSLVSGGAPVVVVNGSESEPASWKDRALMRGAPHLVLDGAVVAARAINAREIIITCHDELAVTRLHTAIAERQRAEPRQLLVIRVHRSSAPYVGGEARAVMQTLNKRRGVPTGRRVHPTTTGVGGAPTLLSNVETFAHIAVLVRLGLHRFSETGVHGEPGTTLLSVGGAVGRPGVMEVPTGTPLSIVLAASQAPPDLQAIILGGYHGSWHQPIGSIQLSREGVRAAGGSLGAGVVLALDHQTCALGELHRVASWLANQSAQQCGPCRFGLPSLAADVGQILGGDPRGVEVALTHARAVTGRGACSHPDGAARFVVSGLHALLAETDRHLHSGGCGRPVVGVLPL